MNGRIWLFAQTKNSAYAAAARRRLDRSLKARIESALQASKLHYQRTGRCFYITKEIVDSDCVFDELEDEDQFWDPDLLLPEGLTAERLRDEHYDSLHAAGAVFPPHPPINSNELLNGGVHMVKTPLLSQSTDSQSSLSQCMLTGSQLSGRANASPSLSFHGSQTQSPLHQANPTFPEVVPVHLWSPQPMESSHLNGMGLHPQGRRSSVDENGIVDNQMTTRALRSHVRPDAIDEVIGRTTVHLNGWLHDDSNTSEELEDFLKSSASFEDNFEASQLHLDDTLPESEFENHLEPDSDLKHSGNFLGSLWGDAIHDMGNHFEETFHDNWKGDLDES